MLLNEEYVYKLLVFMNLMYNILLYIFVSYGGSDLRWFFNYEKKNIMDYYLIG